MLSYMKCGKVSCEKARRVGREFCEEHDSNVETVPKDESGWVIEKRGSFPVEYLCASSAGFEFTTDNLKAIRFCRRQDANQVAEILDGEDVAIVEHMWCAVADGDRAERS